MLRYRFGLERLTFRVRRPFYLQLYTIMHTLWDGMRGARG